MSEDFQNCPFWLAQYLNVLSVVSESSSQASLKEEFTTPPDSPINTRKTQLKKEPSFDRFSQSPPTSPVLKAKLSDASKDGRLSPGSAGLREGHLSTVPARRDSFGSPNENKQ
jgi:hypothetical protein